MRQYYVGTRSGLLKELINLYKYRPVRAVSNDLARLLAELPVNDGVVVPLPTIGKHIRGRGFDHIETMARAWTRSSAGLKLAPVLRRHGSAVQVGANAKQRLDQAREAYTCTGKLDAEKRYLLLDDVWTTGASMKAAATMLRRAGAKQVDCVIIAKSG